MELRALRVSVLAAAVCAFPPIVAAQAPAGPAAETVFKNIKVFTGKPADLLRPTMTYISSSLGVECNFCHDTQDFSADTKNAKSTAREMIAMVYAINKDNFNNRPQVECYTCHQGHNEPHGNLPVATPESMTTMAAMQENGGRGGRGGGPGFGGRGPQAGGMTPQALLDKYMAALGGQAAVDAVRSATITATRKAGANATPETIAWKAGAYTDTLGGREGGYDGREYYSAGRGGREASSPDVAAYQQLDAALFPGLAWRNVAANARVQGPRDIDGRSSLTVAIRANGAVQTFYYDAGSGLLYRFATSTPTLLGGLPLQVDYGDYRAVDGVQVPFTTTFATVNQLWTRTVSDVKLNP